MRKFIIMLMLLSVAAFAAAPQKPLELGARLGASLMYVTTDSEEDIYPSNGGFGAALSFDVAYGFTDRLYLHSGLGVDFRGFAASVTESAVKVGCLEGCSYETTEDLKYSLTWALEMPLLLQWRIPGIAFFEAGAVFDVQVATKGNGTVNETPDSVEDLNHTFGVSLAVGIGHKFNSGLSLDFRILYQLTDLIDADAFGNFDLDEKFVPYGSYYNLLKFQIGVGYFF